MKRRILFYLGWQLTLAVFLLSAGIHVSCTDNFTGDNKDPVATDTTAATDAGCDDPSTYGITSSSTNVICVDPSGASSIDFCQPNTVQTTIQGAIDAVTTSGTAIFIINGGYIESLNSFDQSDTSLVGCTKSGVTVASSSSPTIDTHTVDLESSSTISFYNMTLQGIGGYTGSATDDELSNAATFFASNSTFTLSNVGLTNNFYQAIKLADSSSTGTVSTVDLSTPYSASNASFPDATSIGIWNEGGTLSVSGLTFGSTFDTGIVSNGGTLTLAADATSLTNNTFSGMLTPIYLAEGATLSTSSDLTSTVITSSTVGIWSEDMSSGLSLSSLSMDGTNTYDLIGCQTTGTDAATVIYNLNYNTLPTLIFGTVTVEGGGSGTTTEANVLGTVYVDETTVLNDQFATYGTSPYIVSCNRGDY